MKPLLIICLLALGLAACGADDTVSVDEANRIAGELALQTQALSEDVADTARALADDPARADEARDRLEDLEQRARDLAEEAQDLPDSADAREQLREANDRIAEAANELAEADPAQEALNEGRSRLEQANDRVAEAVDRLVDDLPPQAREDLEALREQLSSQAP